MPDAAIAAAIDADNGAEVVDAASRLCRLASFNNAWGLAHVLRLVSKEGAPTGSGNALTVQYPVMVPQISFTPLHAPMVALIVVFGTEPRSCWAPGPCASPGMPVIGIELPSSNPQAPPCSKMSSPTACQTPFSRAPCPSAPMTAAQCRSWPQYRWAHAQGQLLGGFPGEGARGRKGIMSDRSTLLSPPQLWAW
jgi:hypothetical protein